MTKFDYLFCFFVACGLMISATNNDWFSALSIVLLYAGYENARKIEVHGNKK